MSWLGRRAGWVGYGLVWATLISGHSALFVFSGGGWIDGLITSARIMLPLALLGLGVVRLSPRLTPPDQPIWPRGIFHLPLSVLFSFLWIAAVWSENAIIRLTGPDASLPGVPPLSVIHWHLLVGVLVYASLVAITVAYDTAVTSVRRLHEAEIRQRLSLFAPHFLFNTLHALGELVQRDPDAAAAAHQHLARLLRRMVRMTENGSERVVFDEEWESAQDYIALQQLRLGKRLRFSAEISEDVRDVEVPHLLLQPLLENAIKYGVAPLANGGDVRLVARTIGDTAQIEITNDQTVADKNDGLGIAHKLLAERLATVYGGRARFQTGQTGEGGYRVSLSFPIEVDTDA